MSKKQFQHFHFLDGLRFLCALWVVFQHLGTPPVFSELAGVLPPSLAPLALLLQKCCTALISGSAAVVAFFIISGFCIHYPYASGKTLQVLPFYLARGVRIGVPLILASLLAYLIPDGTHKISAVLWSLYAEVIYYAIYPILLKWIKSMGMNKVLLLSFVTSAILLLFPDSNGGYLFAYGIGLTWLLCLPIWLLGCWIAEAISTGRYTSVVANTKFMPVLRVSVLLASAACKILTVYTPIELKYSMLVFAPLCAFWIFSEFLQKEPFSWFKNLSLLGRATYSIYLVHAIAPVTLAYALQSNAASMSWPMTMLAVIVLSALFYFGVEKPSHLLSKRLSKIKTVSVDVAPVESGKV